MNTKWSVSVWRVLPRTNGQNWWVKLRATTFFRWRRTRRSLRKRKIFLRRWELPIWPHTVVTHMLKIRKSWRCSSRYGTRLECFNKTCSAFLKTSTWGKSSWVLNATRSSLSTWEPVWLTTRKTRNFTSSRWSITTLVIVTETSIS